MSTENSMDFLHELQKIFCIIILTRALLNYILSNEPVTSNSMKIMQKGC